MRYETFADLLDEARKRLGLPSDYALARRLGLHQTTVKNYRQEYRSPDAWVCAQIADIIGVPPIAVIAFCELRREKVQADRERVRYWQEKAAPLCGSAIEGPEKNNLDG